MASESQKIKAMEAEISRLRKKLREMKTPSLDLSLSQLEELTGIDKPTWSKWLSGKKSPTLASLVRVAPALGMTPGQVADAICLRQKASLAVPINLKD